MAFLDIGCSGFKPSIYGKMGKQWDNILIIYKLDDCNISFCNIVRGQFDFGLFALESYIIPKSKSTLTSVTCLICNKYPFQNWIYIVVIKLYLVGNNTCSPRQLWKQFIYIHLKNSLLIHEEKEIRLELHKFYLRFSRLKQSHITKIVD